MVGKNFWINFGTQSKLRISKKKIPSLQETKHLSTDADSSIDTTVGWTKNTQEPKCFEKWKKIIQNTKTEKRLEICQNLRYTPLTRGL